MSSDTRHKIIAQASSKITSYPLRISAPTDENHKKDEIEGQITFPLKNIRILETQYNLARFQKAPLHNKIFLKTTFDHKRFVFMAAKGLNKS